jgi:organic radical activating enzyme
MRPHELAKAVEQYASPEIPDWAQSETSAGLRAEINNGYLVVITGGEPFRQYLRPAIEELLNRGFGVQIETNGTLYQDLPFDDIVVVCSPKTGSINNMLLPHIQSLKYVLCADDVSDVDGLPLSALKHPCGGRLARPPVGFEGMVLLQPADEQDAEKNKRNLNAVVKSVQEFGYTLQLQIHKLIGVL